MPDFALIPSICLERFNAAAKLAQEGDPAAALVQFERIFVSDRPQDDQDNRPDDLANDQTDDPDRSRNLQGAVTGEFLATVELRKAYCLMDLGRYAEAKAIFAQLDLGLAGQLDTATIYDFYLAYGNTLGNLGQLPAMIDRLAHAMNIASDRLQNPDRFRAVWYWVLSWEKHHEAWAALDEHCDDAYGFGLQNQDEQLQALALEFRGEVDQALGRLA